MKKFYVFLFLCLFCPSVVVAQSVPGGGGGGGGGGTGCDSTSAGNSILKGDGLGGCVAAVDGTDYLGASSALDLSGKVLQGASPLVFEGGTDNAFETTFAITDPTADRTVTFQNASGTVAYLTDNVATASALAANGANCSAGNAPLGVDASGAAEGCFDVATQTELDTHVNGTSVHSATATNTASRIVLRDASGNFSAGTISAALTGNASTATALAADGADCAANQAPRGVDASGAAVNCTAYLPLSAGSGVPLTGQLFTDNLGIEFEESDTNPTCAAGNFNIYADASENKLKKCQNGTVTDLDTSTSFSLIVKEADGTPTVNGVTTIVVTNGTLTDDTGGQVTIQTGGGGGAGDVTAASTFGTDNSCIRSDGTSKGVQSSASNCTIDDNGNVTATSFTSTSSSAGAIYLGQGSAQSLGTTAVGLTSPSSVSSYNFVLPGAAGDGVLLNANASNVVTQSFVGTTGTLNFVRANSPTLSGNPALAAATATSLTTPIFSSNAADPADTGVVRLGNNESVCWEIAASGTDKCLTLNASDVFTLGGILDVTTGVRIGGAATSGNVLRGNGTNFVSAQLAFSDLSGAAVDGQIPDLNALSTGLTASRCVETNGSSLLVSSAGGCAGSITVRDEDGTPSVANVTTIRFTNGTVTDNGSGDVSINVAGGGGSGITSLASQTGGSQTITRGAGIGGTSATNDHSFSLALNTLVNSQTMFDGSQASRTITFDLSGTDPVITLSSGAVNVSTGSLQQGGNNVLTVGSGEINGLTAKATPTTSDLLMIEDAAASNAKKKSTVDQVLAANDARTKTLTNTTIDAEGTGNLITMPLRFVAQAAGCNNATAGAAGFEILTANSATATCYGTNPHRFAGLDFADGASALEVGFHFLLPSDLTGNIDFKWNWFSGSTSTNSVVWTIKTACVADGEDLLNPTYNSAQTVTDANNATASTRNSASQANVTQTGCAAGETLFVKFGRDPTNASDTLAATAVLMDLEVTYRRAI